jgi:hypothetical protein
MKENSGLKAVLSVRTASIRLPEEGLSMLRTRWLIGLMITMVLVGGLVLAQDKPATRLRGQLPPNWSKLGLDDQQKTKVYEVQSEYRTKIDALQAQIKQLQKQERGELEKILTDSQKTRLKEIVTSKALGESGTEDKKADKKPAPDKN